MKDYWVEPQEKRVNKKRILMTIFIFIIVILSIIFAVIYCKNEKAREWIDKNILRKEIMQDNTITLELKEGENEKIYAYSRYIGILNKNQFQIYGASGNEEKKLEIQVSNPIFNSSNRFLTIAEKNGQRLYLITDKDISWEVNIEGDISQVHVNKNGYVAVVIADTSYKTVVAMYNPQGKEMFKTYLSSTRTTDVAISNDNKYLAIAEVDTSGTIIQSSIKIISIEKASSDPTNSLENTFKGGNNKLITNLRYHDKDKLICMYTDSINLIENGEDKTLIDNNQKKVIFQSIELTNHITSIEEKSSGLFTADSVVSIVNTEGENAKEYIVDSVAKEIYTYGNIIALNLGTEIEFINTEGWLVKRYIANQEITNVVVSDNIAGIIYRDKVEIINL